MDNSTSVLIDVPQNEIVVEIFCGHCQQIVLIDYKIYFTLPPAVKVILLFPKKDHCHRCGKFLDGAWQYTIDQLTPRELIECLRLLMKVSAE